MQYGILGLVLLVLYVIAIIDILGGGMDASKKLIWILVVVLLPVIGTILWYVIGKKGGV